MTSNLVIFTLSLIVATTISEPSGRHSRSKSDPHAVLNENYRLPNTSVPTSYLIKVTPYIVVDNFTFDGEASISLRVLEPTSNVTLHTNGLTYNENATSFETQDGISYHVASQKIDSYMEFLTIEFNTTIPIGNYTLNLTYIGIINNATNGFHRTSYVNDAGDTVWLAVTTFEPSWARWAFPCYDEPGLKATWNIWIKHESKFHALSNMPVLSNTSDPIDGKIWTIFQTTPPMSSYLVAFIVSDFKFIQNEKGTIKVWAKSNGIEKSRYALERGIIQLKALEEYTNISFTLPKIDHVSIPVVSPSAMENWGLVTYREGTIYLEGGDSDITKKHNIDAVIAHELAHQWFGNLVSPRWWQYTWLNEGFATYFEYLLTSDNVSHRPKMYSFVVERQAISLAMDAFGSSNALNHQVSSPHEILAKFSDTTYNKGCSVIRMMAHFLTEERFKVGLRKYLAAHAYSSATSDDLFSAMQEAINDDSMLPLNVDVRTVMNTWIEQSGYPLVTVTRNYTSGSTEFRQERYVRYLRFLGKHNVSQWWIPLSWATQSDPNFDRTVPQKWLPSDESNIFVDEINSSDWILVNVQQTGFYRVNYDITNWNRIAAYLNTDQFKNIHVLNRAQLLYDAFDLAGSDHIPYSVALNIASYLHQEVDCLPWRPALNGFRVLNDLLKNTESYQYFKGYLVKLTSKVFEAIGIEQSEDDDSFKYAYRDKIVALACSAGLESCRISTHNKLLSWLEESESIGTPVKMKSFLRCAGIRSANVSTWNRIWNMLPTVNTAIERYNILNDLGCSDNVDIINNWILKALSNDSVLKEDELVYALEYIFSNRVYNVDAVFDAIENNFSEFSRRFPDRAVTLVLFNISRQMTTRAQLNRFRIFGRKQSLFIRNFLESVSLSFEPIVARTETYEPEMRNWFINNFLNITESENITPTSSDNSQINDISLITTSDIGESLL